MRSAYFLILLFISQRIFSETIFLEENSEFLKLLSKSKIYYDSSESMVIENIIKIPESNWESIDKNHHSFGFKKETIWIKFKLKNTFKQQSYYIVSEYAWVEKVNFFKVKEKKVEKIESNGSSIPVNSRNIKYKLPVFFLSLDENEEVEMFISFNSSSEKLISLTLENNSQFLHRNTIDRDFFIPFALSCILVIFINLIIAIKNKGIAPLLYVLMMLSILVYLSLLNGFTAQFLFPNRSFEGDKTQFIFGFLFISFFFLFWKKFLFLNLYMERLNKIYSFMFVSSFLFPVAFYFNFLTYELMELFARLYLLFSMATSIYSAAYVLSQNFKPALYSCIGLPVSFFFANFYFFSGIGIFSGNDFTKNSIYYGFLIELLIFFYSLSIRFNFLEMEVGEARQTTLETLETRFTEKIKKKRIDSITADLVVLKLIKLMEEEKIFCDEDLRLGRLAEILEIRPDQLSELINENFNKNFNVFISDYRIKEAELLLINQKDRSILSIAYSCGYNSKSAFNLDFKNRTGLTPKQFRIKKLNLQLEKERM